MSAVMEWKENILVAKGIQLSPLELGLSLAKKKKYESLNICRNLEKDILGGGEGHRTHFVDGGINWGGDTAHN